MDELFLQLARRVQSFKDRTGLSSRQICRLSGISEQQMSDLLNGRRGLGTSHTIQLLQVLNGNKKAHSKSAQIYHLQQGGKPIADTVHFDLPGLGGWVAGQSGSDPDDPANDITTNRSAGSEGGDPDDDPTVNTLRQLDLFYKQGREAIAVWFANYRKASVNRAGSTSLPRQVARPKTPGPRGDLLP